MLLNRLLLDVSGETGEWPTDEAFRAAWKSQPVYANLQHSRTVHILRRLSDTYLAKKTEHIIVESPLTVEHIMPQHWVENWPLPDGSKGLTDTEIWTAEDRNDPKVAMSQERNRIVHTIGNLTIVVQELNASMSNSAWQVKAPALLKSSLLPINLQLQSVEEWNETTIEKRADELCSRAIQIWPRPVEIS